MMMLMMMIIFMMIRASVMVMMIFDSCPYHGNDADCEDDKSASILSTQTRKGVSKRLFQIPLEKNKKQSGPVCGLIRNIDAGLSGACSPEIVASYCISILMCLSKLIPHLFICNISKKARLKIPTTLKLNRVVNIR